MKSTQIGTARVIVVAVALAAVALAYVDGQGPVAVPASASADQAAATDPARQALEVQAEVGRADLLKHLEAALGDDFGGVWYDSSGTQLHVGVTSAASRRNAEAVALQAGLPEIVIETPVRSTWSQLLAAQERWGRRVADLFARAEVKTSIATDLNTLDVVLGSEVSQSRRAALERAASEDSVAVSIGSAAERRLILQPAAECVQFVSKTAANCQPQIKAGVRIEDETNAAGGCTAGPAVVNVDRKAKAAATETFILTAGHCIHVGGGVTKKWYAFDKAKTKLEIGKPVNYIAGETDIGVIKVEPGNWAKAKDPIPVVPFVALWDTTKETDPIEVTAQEKPAVNQMVCFSGQRSGHKCGGKIESTTLAITVELTKGVNITIKNLNEVKLAAGKAGKGDSGGPVVTESDKSKVLGVLNAVQEEGATEEGKIYAFQSLETAFAKLKSEKALDLELLTKTNKKRHGDLKGGKYPVTIHGATTGVEEFSTEAGTIKCKTGTYHAVLSEASSTLTVSPEYKACTGPLGVEATISMEGCAYVFHVTEKVSEDNYHAYTDISCSEGKSIKVTAGTCKFEVKSQSELETVDLIDDTAASPKKDVTARPTLSSIAYVVTQDGAFCTFAGTGEKKDGKYNSSENITLTGQSTTEASEKIDIEVADQ